MLLFSLVLCCQKITIFSGGCNPLCCALWSCDTAPTFQVGPHHCCIGWRIIYEDFGVIYFLEDPSPSCIKWCENLWRPSGLFIELPSIPSWGRLVGSSLIFPVDVPFLRVFGLLFGVVFFAFDVAFLPGQYFLHWICVHFGEGIIELTHP